TAKAAARIDGWVTLARMVLVGPVLKNRQKHARKMNSQATGKPTYITATKMGKPTNIAADETRKYEPEKRFRNASPANPPRSVPVSPATVRIAPKIVRLGPDTPRYSCT